MHQGPATSSARRAKGAVRIAWTVVRVLVIQSVICGAAAALPLLAVRVGVGLSAPGSPLRPLTVAAMAVPAYFLFALLLMLVSGLACRVLGWGTPRGVEMRIADVSRPLLRWAEYMIAIHVVRFFAGALLRGTPLWTAYLRLAGARLGRRVYVNSLGLSDYNLLEFGDDVIVGADAHIAGHTVERGVVKTAGVRLGRGVTVGVGSIVDIGADAGDGCQIAALSFVPKFATLDPHALYGGIPVRRLTAEPPRRQAP